MLGAKPSLLGQDPAAVLVFTASSAGFEAAKNFDAWYKQPHKYPYAIYAILVNSEKRPAEMLEEALRQRNFSFPLFITEDDLLEGKPVRILLLSGGAFRELPEFDATGVESRMNDLAAHSGLEAAAPATSEKDSASTGPGEKKSEARHYANRRYGFMIEFPPNWEFRAAQNGDGAVGKAPANSTLDFRAWGTPTFEETEQGMRRLNIKSYLAQHLEFIGESAKSQVSVDRKYVVHDDSNAEGRDYTYSYIKTGSGGEQQRMKGRIQLFELNGALKVANVEGPAQEFDRSEKMIEDYFYSFRPLLESGTAVMGPTPVPKALPRGVPVF